MRVNGCSIAMLALVLALGTAGCKTGFQEKIEPPTPPEREKAQEAEATEKGLEAKFAESFSGQMRSFGAVVKSEVRRCKSDALDRISPPAAAKMMPVVSLQQVRNACGRLASFYQAKKVKLWGSHFTVDSLLGKLAKVQDAYAIATKHFAENKPSDALREGLQELINGVRSLERTAGAVSEFNLDVLPKSAVEREKVSKGKLRARFVQAARQADKADLVKLLDKFDAYAFNPAREGHAVRVASLEHFGMVYKHRMANRRKAWDALFTDDPAWDDRMKAVGVQYINTCEGLVDAYLQAAAPYLEGVPPDDDVAKPARDRIAKRLESWQQANAAFGDQLAEVH